MAPNGALDDHCGARRAQGGPKVGQEGSQRGHVEPKRGLRRPTVRPRGPKGGQEASKMAPRGLLATRRGPKRTKIGQEGAKNAKNEAMKSIKNILVFIVKLRMRTPSGHQEGPFWSLRASYWRIAVDQIKFNLIFFQSSFLAGQRSSPGRLSTIRVRSVQFFWGVKEVSTILVPIQGDIQGGTMMSYHTF